jgi:hypothetical protein
MMGLGAVGGYLGSRARDKEMRRLQRLQMEMFKKAIGALDKSTAQAFGMFELGRSELSGAKKAALGSYKTGKQQLTAGQQQSAELMKAAAKQAASKAESTSYGRGLMGTTLGQAGQRAALASMSQTAQAVGAQNAMNRAQMAQQFGGQMAQLGVTGMGQAMQGANMATQMGQAKANLYGSFTPLANTAKADFMSSMGGMLMGAGSQGLLGGLGGGGGGGGLPMGSPMMGQTFYGPGFGTPSPFMQPNAQQFGFTPYQFGSGGF